MKQAFFAKQQRGAVALATPLIVLLILSFTVLLLDGARLYAAKRNMQSVANAAATAAADFNQACGSLSATPSLADVQARAESAAAQRDWDGEGTLAALVGTVVSDTDDGGSPILVFESRPMLQSNAAAVRYTRPHAISLLFGDLGTVELTATAVAKKELQTGLTAQSHTASLDTTESALLNLVIGEILQQDGGLALSGVSFESLRDLMVDAEVMVADLAGGTAAEDILATEVTGQVLLEALRNATDASGPAAVALDELVAAAGVNTNLALADVISAAGGGSIPDGARIPALAVINATVFNIGKSLPDVISVDLSDSAPLAGVIGGIVGLDSVTLDLDVEDAPAIVFAPARQDADGQWLGEAESTDVAATLNLGMDLDLVLAEAIVDLPLTLTTGQASVAVVGARCARGAAGDGGNDVFVATDIRNSLLALNVTDGTAEVTSLGATVAEATINADSGNHGGGGEEVAMGPFNLHEAEPLEEEIGDSSDALSNAVAGLLAGMDIDVTVLGLLPLGLDDLSGTLAGAIGPIVELAGELIIDPLADALGLSLGGASVTVTGAVQSPVILLEEVVF